MATPRLEINLGKIAHNSNTLQNLYGSKNISICAVTKVVCSDIHIAQTLVSTGITMIADSKISNLQKLHTNGVKATFLLIGTPCFSQAADIIQWADISNNSELLIIKELSKHAVLAGITHQIILMIEMGDLREGIMPVAVSDMVSEVILLDGIQLIGLGTNLACLNGIRPTRQKMNQLSRISSAVEKQFHLTFTYLSGGNSANYEWFRNTPDTGSINHLRVGESLFLGVDPSNRQPIPHLFTDIFKLVTEVTELKTKPRKPFGEQGQATFGQVGLSAKKGEAPRAILGVGRQDVDVSGLTPDLNIEILASGSDHLIIDSKKIRLRIGDEVTFNLNYAALLSAMTSPYVEKITVPAYEFQGIL